MMNNDSTTTEDIKVIRKFMEESSRFLSLSGLSGIFAGVTAIAGALAAYLLIPGSALIISEENFKSLSTTEILHLKGQLIADAALVLVIAVLLSLYFSIKMAKRNRKNIWTPVSRRMLINLLIPLVTGGIFIFALLIQNHIGYIVPCFLIFYGLALVNAGKFTLDEVFYLGILEISTGLASAFVPGLGLIAWMFGFGFLHIAYGMAMFRKYGA